MLLFLSGGESSVVVVLFQLVPFQAVILSTGKGEAVAFVVFSKEKVKARTNVLYISGREVPPSSFSSLPVCLSLCVLCYRVYLRDGLGSDLEHVSGEIFLVQYPAQLRLDELLATPVQPAPAREALDQPGRDLVVHAVQLQNRVGQKRIPTYIKRGTVTSEGS